MLIVLTCPALDDGLAVGDVTGPCWADVWTPVPCDSVSFMSMVELSASTVVTGEVADVVAEEVDGVVVFVVAPVAVIAAGVVGIDIDA